MLAAVIRPVHWQRPAVREVRFFIGATDLALIAGI
jgi:hypothetical protein